MTLCSPMKETGMRIAGLLAVIVVLQGCSIRQEVTPIVDADIQEITIIENPDVMATFLDAIKAAVEKQGVTTQVGPPLTPTANYPYALTYTANWTWDMTLYLVYAEINVFERDRVIGKAVYDCTRGGGRLDKFVNAESKVKELIGELFGQQK
jgi:hypothetical protein